MAGKIRISISKLRRVTTEMPEPGARPGTLQIQEGLPPPVIQRTTYTAAGVQTDTIASDELDTVLDTSGDDITWIDVHGIGDATMLQRLGAFLNLNPLTLEDIAHTHQRPKLEEFDDYLFVTTRSVRTLAAGKVDNEQISFGLKDPLLVSFQERAGDGFDPIRKRLQEGKGPIRRRGADYLLYAPMDVIIDNYFPVIEIYGDTMEQLEDQIRLNPTPGLADAVHALRRELRLLRRAVWPMRDVAGKLGRNEVERIDDALRASFRDCYDHVVQVADFIDGSRERASDLGDLYQTMVSEKTNQVMKTLTIVATIFIPLTFLCGLYGMNFDPDVSPYNMPELKWRYGYVGLWGVMTATLVGMLWFFRRRGWLGQKRAVVSSSK